MKKIQHRTNWLRTISTILVKLTLLTTIFGNYCPKWAYELEHPKTKGKRND